VGREQCLGAVQAHRRAQAAVELDHRRHRSGVTVCAVVELDVVRVGNLVQRIHIGLGDHPGRATLKLRIEVGEHVNRTLGHVGLRHSLLRLLQSAHPAIR